MASQLLKLAVDFGDGTVKEGAASTEGRIKHLR